MMHILTRPRGLKRTVVVQYSCQVRKYVPPVWSGLEAITRLGETLKSKQERVKRHVLETTLTTHPPSNTSVQLV